MQVGNVVGETSLNLQRMCDKELTLMTCFRYRNVYPVCIEAIAAGRINVKISSQKSILLSGSWTPLRTASTTDSPW